MNLKSIFINSRNYLFIFILLYSVLLSSPLSRLSQAQSTAAASTTDPNTKTQEQINKLKSELEEAQKRLNRIKSDKENVRTQIANESKSQEKLSNDSKYIESVIKQNDLKVQDLKLELEQLNEELTIKKNEKEQIEVRLTELTKQKNELYEESKRTTKQLYKASLSTPTLLDDNGTFEDAIINEEKLKSLIKIAKANIDEIQKLEDETAKKKQEVQEKENELSNLQNDKLAQSNNLKLQQEGLLWQKNNKQALIEKSKQSQQTLSNNQQNLDSQQKDVSQQIAALDQQISQLRNSLYSAPVPAAGTPVKAGQIIGFQGRTGWVCAYVSDADIKKYPPSDYNNQYCGKPFYFFPDINKYPLMGAHIHFGYYKNGKHVYPEAMLTNPVANPEFEHLPMQGFRVTRGYHQNAEIDLDGGYGAPVFAVKPGKIEYYCDRAIPSNPAYGAVIYHDDGSKSQYWHLKKDAGSPPCKQL